MVASIIAYSLSGSSAKALKRLSQTPFFAQRENRVWTFFQAPNRSGRSRHGAPERNFQITASTNRWNEANIHRIAGEITLMTPEPDAAKAEACFERGLAVAREQQAKSWELRAATSMARLWQDQGKRRQARDLLAPVYGWFTEGFDTLDLKGAKALPGVMRMPAQAGMARLRVCAVQACVRMAAFPQLRPAQSWSAMTPLRRLRPVAGRSSRVRF